MAGVVLHLTEEENIVLSAPVLRRLTGTKNADACLLYLCLKQNGDAMDEEKLRESLSWEKLRFDAAKAALARAELIRLPEKEAGKEAPLPAEQPPQYTQEDVMRRMEGDEAFAQLLREVERRLGPLSTASLKILLELNEYLGLPCDVIYLLVNDCIACKEERFGAGRRPTMREIEKEGYAWARRELFSVQAVDEFLKKEQRRRRLYPDYMAALQMPARTPSPGEEKYIKSWLEMGFPPETVAIAYDKTVLKCHEFKWPYCNGILKKWHEKNLHTPQEVQSETAATGQAAEKKTPGKNAWMKQYH